MVAISDNNFNDAKATEGEGGMVATANVIFPNI
jgi:hypothetical protein